MVSMNEILARRQEILSVAEKHGARNVRVFGSVVRGEATEESDLDFLVEMNKQSSLLDRIAIINELQDLLHSKVDVVNEKALHWTLRDRILGEGVPL